MLKSEFIKKTSFDPMDEEYKEIEQLYYDFNGDQDTFCRCFVADNGIRKFLYKRADTIRNLEQKLKEAAESTECQVKALETEIEKLKEALDKELEWKPCSGGTNLDQERYEDLLHAGGTELLTEEEAKKLIYEEFGFAPSKTTIISSVSTYEVDKYHRMRILQRHERKAVYNATDWNYVRFNCTCWMYEMVNGSLQTYEC